MANKLGVDLVFSFPAILVAELDHQVYNLMRTNCCASFSLLMHAIVL